uniref:ATP-dependent DNA helicase n=1 Tax=Panagrolaimus davidi TaxID=227884 RepID=A0A914PXN8_9BILA
MQDMKDNKQLFGGSVVLIGGDWKQLTPVVPKGNPEAVIDASIKKWDEYDHCKQIELKKNMRVNEDEIDFIQELKHIGNGDTEGYSNYIKGTDYIKVDEENIAKNALDLMNFCYEPQWLAEPEKYAKELCGSAILCPTNTVVKRLNQKVLNNLSGRQQKTFFARNTPLGDQPLNALTDNETEYSIEAMEKIETAGMPPHELNLKNGAIVMLIKNISVNTGLCNGTRMQITEIFDDCIKCKVLSGSRSDNSDEIFLPRCKFEYGGTPSEPGIHFSRCQFPVKLSFAMSINKSQGQTLQKVGIYLRQGECFSHGQLYTAMSRVRTKKSIKIVTAVLDTNNVKNVVWKQLLD